MAKKLAGFFGIVLFFLLLNTSVFAQAIPTSAPINTDPLPCSMGNCPKEVQDLYPLGNANTNPYFKEKCVDTYAEFVKNPLLNHFWSLDEEVTTQGKANERARQFLYWVMTKSAIDQHPAIRQIWTTTQMLHSSYFFW